MLKVTDSSVIVQHYYIHIQLFCFHGCLLRDLLKWLLFVVDSYSWPPGLVSKGCDVSLVQGSWL